MSNPLPPHLDDIAELQNGDDSNTSGDYYLSRHYVVFQSTDNVKFHVYKKELASSSGGFPPAEFVSDTRDPIDLPEKAVVLDLLFSFTRPQRYPDLHALEIEILEEFGDAAEKYEVYAAIITCKTVMRMNTSLHPLRVFKYAAKYEYQDLVDLV
ncbi:hypothetical protein BDN72DRAFT_861600 [Pluteus cervinus]|uniref:Uncharacterized protein n=1 Tax=Pluteus cervinus TaxID=181527 RepID=A0ACD3AEF4_9AGAR|nr:hypothetical protein BDN72DRAFT_861600 [Pluteus cervinus]